MIVSGGYPQTPSKGASPLYTPFFHQPANQQLPPVLEARLMLRQLAEIISVGLPAVNERGLARARRHQSVRLGSPVRQTGQLGAHLPEPAGGGLVVRGA